MNDRLEALLRTIERQRAALNYEGQMALHKLRAAFSAPLPEPASAYPQNAPAFPASIGNPTGPGSLSQGAPAPQLDDAALAAFGAELDLLLWHEHRVNKNRDGKVASALVANRDESRRRLIELFKAGAWAAPAVSRGPAPESYKATSFYHPDRAQLGQPVCPWNYRIHEEERYCILKAGHKGSHNDFEGLWNEQHQFRPCDGESQ